jgi:hypothetical protein
MKIAAILFAYKRIKILKRVLRSYKFPNGIDKYCFVDHSINSYFIATLAIEYGFITTIRSKRYGLNDNITCGINEVFAKGYDAVIVLEDDIVISEDAIYYLVQKLILLKDDKNCGSVSLDRDLEFNPIFRCWGWGIWHDRWEKHTYKQNCGTQATQISQFHQENKLYCYCSQKKRNKHISWHGEHFNWYSPFGIRPILRKIKKIIKRYDIYFRSIF